MADFTPMDDFAPEEAANDDNEAETSFIEPEMPMDDDDAEVWEASNEPAPWSQEGRPAGLLQRDVANWETTQALVKRWKAALKTNAEGVSDAAFVSSKKGDLWVRKGQKWRLLTYKNDPGRFLRASTLKRYGADVTKFLGVHERGKVSRAALAQAEAAEKSLAPIARDLDTTQVKGLAAVADAAIEASGRLAGSFGVSDAYTDEGERIEMREILGLDKVLRSIRGELQNNLAKLSELDADIARQETKLKEANDLASANDIDSEADASRRRIEDRLRDLRLERDARLEALSTNRAALRSQVSRIRETISKMLNEDTTLAERIKTLFREQGITIASILTALGMAISTLVVALTGGGGSAAPTPAPPTPDKGGIKEWVKRQLNAIKRLLSRLAEKAAAALPGIIGSVVSWLLSTIGKAVGWLAENTWALIVGAVGLLVTASLSASRDYISRPRQ